MSAQPEVEAPRVLTETLFLEPAGFMFLTDVGDLQKDPGIKKAGCFDPA